MKGTDQLFDKPLLIAFLSFLLSSLSGFLIVEYFTAKVIKTRSEVITKKVRVMVDTFLRSKEEAIFSYYRQISNDRTVLDLLRSANKGDEEERKRVRIQLVRHLFPFYQELFNKDYINQMNFILSDNTFLIRFHILELYGDDARLIRKTVSKANMEKKTVFGFEVGLVASSYRFVFPIGDREGMHLGVIDFGVGVKNLTRGLTEITPDSSIYLFVKEDVVNKVVHKLYRQYFLSLPELKGWRVEAPQRDFMPRLEDYSELRTIARSIDEEYLNSTEDKTLIVSVRGKPYEVTLLKFRENEDESHDAVLIYLKPSDAVETIISGKYVYFSLGTVLSFLASVFLYLLLKSRKELKEAYTQLETITSSIGGGVVVYNREGRVIYVNNTATRMLGYRRSEILGSVFHDLVHYHTGPLEQCPIYRAVLKGENYENEDSFIAKDGSFKSVFIQLRPLFLKGERVGGILTFYDITERKQKEEELFRLATTDHLTGLYNRRFTESFLKMAEDKANNRDIPFSLIMIDIDNFKNVNDTFGHIVGDLVLVEVAKLLRDSLRFPDVAARWGGEEFLVLLDSTELENALRVAERLREKASELSINGIKITISLGVAQHQKGDSFLKTIERADQALYEAKRSGKNRVCKA